MLTATRGDVAMPAGGVSPEALLSVLVARTPPPPASLRELVRAACLPSPRTEEPCRSLARGILTWLGPLLDDLHGPWPADDLRRRALATAWSARCFAGETNDAGAAFVSGLLTRVGQLALYAHFPKGYARAIRGAARRAGGIIASERDVFGVDHALAGKRLAETWGLPGVVRDAIWFAHQPPLTVPSVHQPTVTAVRRADLLVRREGIGWPDFLPLAPDAADAEALAHTPVANLRQAVESLLEDQVAIPAPKVATPAPIVRGPIRDVRVPWREALNELLAAPISSDISQLCGEVARSVCTATGAAVALGFAVDERAAAYPAAIVGAESMRTSLPVTDELRSVCTDARTRAIHDAALVVRAPGAMLATGPSIARSLSTHTATPMLLSLVHGDRLVGGVIFAGADESTLSKLAAEDVALLAGVYARVLAGALDAEDQRTLAETFATANQQAGTTERATSQAARLRMLATMAAGAAHELNTPLAVIAGRAQMLQRDATDARTQQDLAVIAEHAHRASAIVSELLACAKPEPPRAETVMLSAWAHGVRQYWHDAAGPKPAQIDVRISDDALVVQADPQQLDEAVHAIIANAIEAAPAGGARVVINSPSRPTDDTIVVSIGDNGCGMTPDVLAHACDPFFSHRTAGRGRGLGLSRATRLIEINGGRMWIDSTPGQGTTVHVALPAAQ